MAEIKDPKVDITIDGNYRLLDTTPEPDWSMEDIIKWVKRNVTGLAVLIGSVYFLYGGNVSPELKTLSLTSAGASIALLLGDESYNRKKK